MNSFRRICIWGNPQHQSQATLKPKDPRVSPKSKLRREREQGRSDFSNSREWLISLAGGGGGGGAGGEGKGGAAALVEGDRLEIEPLQGARDKGPW